MSTAGPGPVGEAAASRRRGYLSLGSNLGDRRAHLQSAVDGLQASGLTVSASSHTYDTEPVGLVLDQPEFLNACLQIETELEPEQLLDSCKRLERKLGRAAAERHAPRVIDIDILLLGELVYETQRLTVPHPELTARRFVLVPLLELDPDLTLPRGERLAGSLAALGGGQEVRVAGPPLNV